MSAPPTPQSTEAATVWRHLGELVALHRCGTDDLARELDLSPVQLVALRHLDPDVPQPMGRLACALACDKGNVTGIVDRLERRGLVERRPDPADRRVKTLALTATGAQVRAEAERRLCAPPDALADLGPDELARLGDALGRVVDELRDGRA